MWVLLQLIGGWPGTSSSLEHLIQTPDEQQKQSWAKFIPAYDAVPEIFKGFFPQDGGHEFPYTILTPAFNGFIQKTTEKLICVGEDEIIVLERTGDTYAVHCYPLGGINCIEVQTLLLNSSIKICGMTRDGVSTSSTFTFNSVTDYLFTPILRKMRHASEDTQSGALNLELAKFDHWRKENFKFMNYARRSLLAGEKVIYKILQPEIREVVFKIFGRTYDRVRYPTLACILTDRELIMIREEKAHREDGKYGGTWHYIPLKKILRPSVHEQDKNLLTFSIKLTEGTRRVYLFQPSTKRELNRLLYFLDELVIG